MAIDVARAYSRQYDMEHRILEFDVSSVTVERTIGELERYSNRVAWVDVCKDWQ